MQRLIRVKVRRWRGRTGLSEPKGSALEGKSQEGASPTEVLRTRRLEIVDEKGKVRAVLGAHENGSVGLDVFDNAGKIRASYSVADDAETSASGVQFFDADGKMRAHMTVRDDAEKSFGLSILDVDEK